MIDGAPLAAAVLCGGAARRMGRAKATLMLDGATLLDRALERLRPIATHLLIASGDADLRRPGCMTVHDSRAGCGPLGGIVAALGASPAQRCAIVAVDMPHIDAALLRSLAQRCENVDAVVPVSERRPEPLHAVYARAALPVLRRMLHSSDLSMAASLSALRVRYVDARSLGAAAGFAVNLNRPDDLRALLKSRAAAG